MGIISYNSYNSYKSYKNYMTYQIYYSSESLRVICAPRALRRVSISS